MRTPPLCMRARAWFAVSALALSACDDPAPSVLGRLRPSAQDAGTEPVQHDAAGSGAWDDNAAADPEHAATAATDGLDRD